MEETLKHLAEIAEGKIEAKFIFQALELYCRVKKKPTIELLDEGISLTWYSKNWGDWTFDKPNDRSMISVHFFRNCKYHHFLWFTWQEVLEPVIMINSIGKVAEFTTEVSSVDEAFATISPYIKSREFTSK